MYHLLLFVSAFSIYFISTEWLYVISAQGSSMAAEGVKLSFQENHVVICNGIVEITLSNPEGHLSGIQYNGIDNLLEAQNDETNRGYWDVVWSPPNNTTKTKGTLERLAGSTFEVIVETDDQVEVSFSRSWNSSLEGKLVPLKFDKRYILLRGYSGFYTYAIYEHLEEWPSFNLDNTRIAFKLRKDKFHYMANSDDRHRYMPLPDDRLPGRGEVLAYPEAVLLVDPVEPEFKGEVDDKYQYACELKDLRVHGWICMDPAVGFWQITPSNEFRVGGPIKPELNSHVGPTTLAVFASTHYGGSDLIIKLGERESWKKVFGPVSIYLNTLADGEDPLTLWTDAKDQMSLEVERWPYDFPASDDFQSSHQRGAISGRLLVQDRFIAPDDCISASGAYVGLAAPGDTGSWQRECKKYQFWTKADEEGYFYIPNVITGEYNLYAWVPGFIGDYKNSTIINITSGANIDMGDLLYEPPRDGLTLWEIGYPDRTAAEFYIPDPNPKYTNSFLLDNANRFRQYGLWDRYAELYPDNDLVYAVEESDYSRDFFFAHVLRKMGDDTYETATWTINFNLDNVNETETYIIRLALASAHQSDLQVRVNDLYGSPLFSTGKIGGDNAIARHGIHGVYWLFNIEVPGICLYSLTVNSIYLTQANNESRFQGVMYDYIRLEAPRTSLISRIS